MLADGHVRLGRKHRLPGQTGPVPARDGLRGGGHLRDAGRLYPVPPGHSLDASDTELAREYEMLPAHIQFRRLIDQGNSHLLGEVMSSVRQAQQEGSG